jgi:hypothetical protein
MGANRPNQRPGQSRRINRHGITSKKSIVTPYPAPAGPVPGEKGAVAPNQRIRGDGKMYIGTHYTLERVEMGAKSPYPPERGN